MRIFFLYNDLKYIFKFSSLRRSSYYPDQLHDCSLMSFKSLYQCHGQKLALKKTLQNQNKLDECPCAATSYIFVNVVLAIRRNVELKFGIDKGRLFGMKIMYLEANV